MKDKDSSGIKMMRKDLIGKRIRCLEMIDDPNPIPSGTEGEIFFVDDMGTIHVKWDNGRFLGLVLEDKYEIL